MQNYTVNGGYYLSTRECIELGYEFSVFHGITPGVVIGINSKKENDLFFPKHMLNTYTNEKVPSKGDPFEMIKLKKSSGQIESF